jgi:hypothetical protein
MLVRAVYLTERQLEDLIMAERRTQLASERGLLDEMAGEG